MWTFVVVVAAAIQWTTAAPGLEVAEVPSPVKSVTGDSKIVVARIDPARYELRLLSAKLQGLERNLTAKEWVQRYRLVGAINASMYSQDQRTSVAFMRDGEHVNNPKWTRDKAVFAAGPRDPALPAAQIIDRSCQDLPALRDRYQILVQNIRMLDCAGRNTWAPRERRWSIACIGTNEDGRVLFIHSRSPYSAHDFVDILTSLPLGLRRLMYVEGGPEASLYVEVGGRPVVSRVGSFETGFFESDDNAAFWPIPNVIGFVPRTAH